MTQKEEILQALMLRNRWGDIPEPDLYEDPVVKEILVRLQTASNELARADRDLESLARKLGWTEAEIKEDI